MSNRKIRLIEPHLTKLTVLMLAALARLQSKALSVEEYAALLKPVQELNKIVRPAARPRFDFLGHLAYYIKEGLAAPDPNLPDPPLTNR